MDELVSIVQACTRLAFSELFANKEHFTIVFSSLQERDMLLLYQLGPGKH